VAERLTFTLAGRDELSRVMNGTADSADRLRLRLAGISADADGSLRDLQGRFLSLADAQRLVDDRTGQVRHSMTSLSDEMGKVGDAVKANLISLLPAAIPMAAGLAGSAAVLAGQLGAVGVAAGAYALALGPQVSALAEAVEAQTKYQDAVDASGATSQEAIKAQVEYQRQLAKLPQPTQEAAVAVGILKDNYQEFSDSLAGDVMTPFTKGVAVANALLPTTTGLVKGTSAQLDRLITLVGGAISTPGFDALNDRFTRIRQALISTSDTKTSERNSASGMCRARPVAQTPARAPSDRPPWSRLHAAIRGGTIWLSAGRGGRAIRSASSPSASNTIEQAGSITISRKAIWIGISRSGKPNTSGSNARPAMGTCTATMYAIALRRLS